MSETAGTEAPKKKSDPVTEQLRTIVFDSRLILAAIAALAGTGWVALAQVQTTAEREAHKVADPVDASVVTLKERLATHEQQSQLTHRLLSDEVVELKDETRQTRAQVEGLREDLRRLFPALPPLPPARDGGTP